MVRTLGVSSTALVLPDKIYLGAINTSLLIEKGQQLRLKLGLIYFERMTGLVILPLAYVVVTLSLPYLCPFSAGTITQAIVSVALTPVTSHVILAFSPVVMMALAVTVPAVVRV